MKLFSTRSTRHLASHIAIEPGACTIKQFSDGELFVRIDEDVQGQTVWVLAGTQPPAENIFELFFLCDALVRAGAQINVCITYLAYARQMVAAPGESHTTQVIASFIKNFPMRNVYIVHPHSDSLHEFLTFTAVRDMNFFYKQAEAYDAIAAPDKGAVTLAKEIATSCSKELILLTKMRPDKEKVEIVSVKGKAKGKKVLLVDDIISTARTITECAHTLITLGATSIAAAVTHGIFSPGSHELLKQSPLERVFVTNTIAQYPHKKIIVVDISQFIQKIMQTSHT